MKQKLHSRKLWLTVLGGVVTGIFFPAMLPAYIKLAVPTYVGVEGAADVAARLAALRGK